MNNATKILLPVVLAFVIGILITPPLTKLFYKYRMWKKNSRSQGENKDITMSDDFKQIHNHEGEVSTPRVGGIIIWGSTLITILLLYILSLVTHFPFLQKLNFLSRSQTLIPLGALILASILGLFDDFAQIFGRGSYSRDSINNRKVKVGLIILMGLLIGIWFVFKLGITSIHIPFDGTWALGIMFIPFFIIIMLGVFSTSVIDGIDGLAAGVLTPIFAAYSVIAFAHNQIDLAAFCAVVTGSILVFLWSNVPPARFYMGETGMLGLTVVLAVVAFLTDTVLVLPIIALPLVATSLSVIVQVLSYKYRNKKRVFLVTPLHHHFEAKGWSKPTVTMRYWIVSIVCSVFGTIIALVS